MAKYSIQTKRVAEIEPIFPLRGFRRAAFFGLLILVIVAALLLAPKTKVAAVTDVSVGTEPPPINPAQQYIFKSGLTESGIQCGPGVRQIPWSKYSPYCEPKFTGFNGGATFNGVTGNSIVITYREASTADLQLLSGLIPPTVIGTNQSAIDTMQAMINTFNHEFELYGRHVVLIPYQGSSDFVQENLGGSFQKAKADAVHVATDIHAFADLSFIDSSSVYTGYLSNQHVISFDVGEIPLYQYQKFSPYLYTPDYDCNKSALGDANVIGRAINGLPAIYTDSPNLYGRPNKVGIIYPEGTTGQDCALSLLNVLKNRYGIVPPVQKALSVNLATISQDASSLIAQFEAAGVTTVICEACDPVTPQFLLDYAAKLNYYPLYISDATGAPTGNVDPFGRLFEKKGFSHAVIMSHKALPASESEAYKAYSMGASPNSQLLPLYTLVYATLLMFFSALQNAGPDLNPVTFAEGMQTLPPSLPGGMFGMWKYGPGVYDPATTFELDYWDPSAISNQDGQLGAFEPCYGGTEISFATASEIPFHHQLECFNNS